MRDNPSVLLVGVGGYGSQYASALLERPDVPIAGYVDPNPQGFEGIDRLDGRAKRYDSVEAFYASGGKADLCVISSPIPFHCQQTTAALEGGSNVLCEKPAAAVPQDIWAMEQARLRTGLHLGIGFQWSHAEAILKLKALIASGRLGKAKRLRSRVLWPRNQAYYQRAAWPGRVKDVRGNFILDSVASNATAHYLHNMYFVLGGEGESAMPTRLTAELYRANPVETFDTVMSRSYTKDGAEILFYASHAVKDEERLCHFVYEFEKGEAVYPYSKERPEIAVRYADGTQEFLGDPFADNLRKLDIMLDLASGKQGASPCPPLAALPLTLSVCAMHHSQPQAVCFPQDLCQVHNQDYTYMEGLQEAILEGFDRGVLPSEMDIPWAKAGREIAIDPKQPFADPGIR